MIKVYDSSDIYTWPWHCCWETSQNIARQFGLRTEVGEEYLKLPTEELAIKKLVKRYKTRLLGFKSLALETGFKEVPDDGKYYSGDIGIFQSEQFGASTIFYETLSPPAFFGGSWLIWTPYGMKPFRKQFSCYTDLSVFRGGI